MSDGVPSPSVVVNGDLQVAFHRAHRVREYSAGEERVTSVVNRSDSPCQLTVSRSKSAELEYDEYLLPLDSALPATLLSEAPN